MRDAQAPSTPGKRRFSCGVSLLMLGLALLVGLISLPSIIVGFSGGFSSSPVYSQRSPDDRSKLVVTKRVIFPANEMVDPSILVKVQLQDHADGRVLDSTSQELLEDSDLKEPDVEWTPGKVLISGIDRRKELTLTLRRGQ
ncbi:hypothetical protein [Verrucomicrobium spinosum]|uniref:hypothetical protein n=1 Tax=Verrucomicrobium spinosum TaxID=2736 RepID=UPI0001745830|nr:hypothetical protein [Verrucomicrobium spinosum]